ncbi:MAG: hypothetical protein AAF919_11615 [Pseudomonadota bacterium]
MTIHPLLVAAALAMASVGGASIPASADGHSDLPTRTLDGLEGPRAGRGIANVPIANEPLVDEGILSLPGYNLRTRSWTISGEGGVVPIHSHADRPAIVYTLAGEIYEYRSDADDRILHGAGGLSLEEGAITHWWLNEGPEEVRLIAFDVFNAGGDDMTMRATPVSQPLDLPEASGADLELLGFVDIGAHYDGAQGAGLVLSTYRATLAPGGVLPSFVDAGEPLQVWVWRGAVTEYRSDTEGPTTLAAEEGAHVGGGARAYWQNDGETEAELFFGVVEPFEEVEGVPVVGIMAHHGE